ncbi:MAG: histidine kinase N-terminal 7TM domain-containing protein [Patescibacteria group bacterium]|nr:histidine kinase N-terminal 7TM domain-containing protein [Patescibacteria group bacterium]MDD5715211.1 histidine kinase N-terminal 7TM domain-containing protein [Patescibacteria group bacterium]
MIEVLKVFEWIVAIVNFGVAFIVLFKAKQRAIKWTFFLLVMVLNGWLITNYLSYLVNTSQNFALLCGRMAFMFGALIAPTFIIFVLLFPTKSKFKLWQLLVLLVPSLVITISSLGPYFAKDQIIVGKEYSIPVYGDYQSVFAMYTLVYVSFAYLLLIRKYRKSISIDRAKLKYIVFGFGPAIVIGFIADLVMPIIDKNHPNFWGPLGTIFISVSFAYSILKYRLMDINLVIRKGVSNFISIALILFLYFYILIFSQRYFVKQFGWSDQTTTLLLVFAIVLTIEPLRRLILKAVDKVFYSNRPDVKDEIREMRNALSSGFQLDRLVNTIRSRFGDFFSVGTIDFFVMNASTGVFEKGHGGANRIAQDDVLIQYLRANPRLLITEEIPYLIEEQVNGQREVLRKVGDRLNSMKVAMALPIGERDNLLGVFLFGEKKGGEAFTADNVSYLTRLQPQMTSAIGNAILYEQAIGRITGTQR